MTPSGGGSPRIVGNYGPGTLIYFNLTQPIEHSPYAGQVMAEYTVSGSPVVARKFVYGEYIDER